MIRYLIIDDEYIAHEIIKGYGDLLPHLELKKSCYDALEALDYLKDHEVDLIFLDLNMPRLKGFDFLKTLPAPPKVIVTTAYKEFALEGYELNVTDYLLKPFSFERFVKAVNKAVDTPASTPLTSVENEQPKPFFLRSNQKHIQIDPASILYIEASGNYSKLVTTKETHTIRQKFSDLLVTFAHTDLLQVHKSFAVAVKHIESIEGNRIHTGSHAIPVGKVYKLKVSELLRGTDV